MRQSTQAKADDEEAVAAVIDVAPSRYVGVQPRLAQTAVALRLRELRWSSLLRTQQASTLRNCLRA